MIFLDTSAIYAMADRGDPRHQRAKERFQALLEAGEGVLTHNYVLAELVPLAHVRKVPRVGLWSFWKLWKRLRRLKSCGSVPNCIGLRESC